MTSARSVLRNKPPKAASERDAVKSTAILRIAIFMLSIVLSAPGAWAAGDAQAGLQLAQRWCTSCHVVDAAGHGTDAAPPFSAIAVKRHKNQSWLRAWLSSPHPRMPDVHLSNQEISDVVAYLNSLAHPSHASLIAR